MVLAPNKMKGPQQGSFGIPPEIQKTIQERQLSKNLNMDSADKDKEDERAPVVDKSFETCLSYERSRDREASDLTA